MSCHNIGRGMNSVVRTVVGLMDDGKVSKDAAKIIIRSCAKGVNWCDGNMGEATDYIWGCICGRCMRQIPKGEKLFSVYDVSSKVTNRYDIGAQFATDRLCEECFDIVLNEQCNDRSAGERERKYIEENEEEKRYISTGAYEKTNNGCRWVD